MEPKVLESSVPINGPHPFFARHARRSHMTTTALTGDEANSAQLRPSIRAEVDDRLEDAEPRCSPFGIGRTKRPLRGSHFGLLDIMPGD